MTLNLAKFEVQAPAKLNLGLEVLGRRADGFHEIATIFAAVDLCDTLHFRERSDSNLIIENPGLAVKNDLIVRALDELRTATGVIDGLTAIVEKRIPIAAGLGGASSDAAAALIAASEIWRAQQGLAAIEAIAAQLGSDVPFFLQGGAAFGTGRGDTLQPLALPGQTCFVVVSPKISIPRKTAVLYASLQLRDFSDGGRIRAQVARLRAGLSLDPTLLGNAFARALYDLVPQLAELPALMRSAGAPGATLSGAGPTHFTLIDDTTFARRIASSIRARLGDQARIFVVTPLPPRYHD